MTPVRKSFLALLLAALACAGCAVRPPPGALYGAPPAAAQVADRALEDRILALDPDRVTAADVRQTLVRGPTPRIMLLHGGIYPVHLSMESFGNFLVAMGYPEARIRDPRDGSWSHSPYTDADQLAGMLAWYYEKDGMPPMLIGHSQGGMQAVKVLYVLDGYYEAPVRVWNPMTDQAEPRTSFKDPLTGRETPVVHGFKVVYASAVGAGGAAFLLPNQWAMIGKLHTIPDTIEEFTGYAIALDLWAWTVPGVDATARFENGGKVHVRNVTLPAANNHVLIPVTADLAGMPFVREWIDAYVPGTTIAPPADSGENVLWAADVWYSVKKYWVIEAQRLIRARRAVPRAAVAGKLE